MSLAKDRCRHKYGIGRPFVEAYFRITNHAGERLLNCVLFSAEICNTIVTHKNDD
jgi:hypothetical protein